MWTLKTCCQRVRLFQVSEVSLQQRLIQITSIHKESNENSEEKKLLSSHNKLKDAVDIVIIGGGIAGCSIAYHLAKKGVKNVLLLEKSELTAGSTWHAAGLTTLFHSGINVKNLHYYSINMYAQLESETGQKIGFHRTGSVRLATSPIRVEELKFQMSRQGCEKAPQKLVTNEEIKIMCPILNMDNIHGGLLNPYDGYVDPYSLTQAMAIGARKHGAQLVFPVQVTGLRLRWDGQWEVTTDHGAIRAKKVVNAAGFWGREVGLFCDLDLPLIPVHHQYLVTSSIPEVQALKTEIPVLRHLDGSFYLRQERDGLLIGPYESVDRMKMCEDWATDRVPTGFGKELFSPDLDRLSPYLEIAMKAVPCFENANIKSVIAGPITYTPDLLPLLGPTAIPGMWLAVGFGYGIIHGGGIGKYLSDWMTEGEPPYDLIELDPLRFGSWTDQKYTFAKARESYGLNNFVGYPHEERMAGRPTSRLSGAHQELLNRGAHMHFHSGWEQPAWFETNGGKPEYVPSFRRTNWHIPVGEECWRVMNEVGVIDLTPFAKFEIFGSDASYFLDYVTANSLPDVGRTCISHCLTPKGKVYAEITITRLEENKYFIITGSGSELHDLRWLEATCRLRNLDVLFQNVTDERGCLSISGPNARKLLEKLTLDEIGKFPFLSSRKMTLGNVDVLALRLSYTGELGWELYCPRESTGKLYTAIIEAGRELGIGDFGTHAMNVLRLEKGFRMWGSEMNKDVTPFEAGLDSFIKMTKGNFIGRSSLLTQLHEGLTKQLVMISINSQDIDPIGDETMWCCGKAVGKTTSGCYSHTTQQTLAFAYLPPFLAVRNTEVQVELLGQLCEAIVLPQPPVETQITRNKEEMRKYM